MRAVSIPKSNVDASEPYDLFHNHKNFLHDLRGYVGQFLIPEHIKPLDVNTNVVTADEMKTYIRSFFPEKEIELVDYVMLYHILKAIAENDEAALNFLVPHSHCENIKVLKIDLSSVLLRLTTNRLKNLIPRAIQLLQRSLQLIRDELEIITTDERNVRHLSLRNAASQRNTLFIKVRDDVMAVLKTLNTPESIVFINRPTLNSSLNNLFRTALEGLDTAEIAESNTTLQASNTRTVQVTLSDKLRELMQAIQKPYDYKRVFDDVFKNRLSISYEKPSFSYPSLWKRRAIDLFPIGMILQFILLLTISVPMKQLGISNGNLDAYDRLIMNEIFQCDNKTSLLTNTSSIPASILLTECDRVTNWLSAVFSYSPNHVIHGWMGWTQLSPPNLYGTWVSYPMAALFMVEWSILFCIGGIVLGIALLVRLFRDMATLSKHHKEMLNVFTQPFNGNDSHPASAISRSPFSSFFTTPVRSYYAGFVGRWGKSSNQSSEEDTSVEMDTLPLVGSRA